jgi:hypothetical protein
VTSREAPSISVGIHTNRSLFCWRKSTSSLSYFGSWLAPICMVLAGCSMSICTTLASSSALKASDVEGIPGLSGITGNQKLSSLSSAVATTVVASSMLLCSQSSAHCVWSSIVMIPTSPGILSLR